MPTPGTPRALCCSSKMIAFVPIFGAAPDQAGHFVCKSKAPAPSCRDLPHSRQSKYIGLIRRNFSGHHILDDGVRTRWPKGDVVELRDPEHIQHRITQPIGMVAFEKIRLANCQWINRPQIDRQIILLGQCAIAPRGKVGIGAAKGPVEVG